MSKKKKEKTASRAPDADWPLGKAGRKGESGLDRFSHAVHATLVRLMSNLRLSLTLRIALHFAGQLLLTTVPVLVVAMGALCVAQVPAADRALEALSALTPGSDGVFASADLEGLPFTEAYLLPEPFDGGLAGLTQRLVLLFSDFEKDGQLRVLLYADTAAGGAAAAYPVDDLAHTMTVLFWTLLCLDLYRVSYFLTRRDRLNRRVLKPITDMAQTAAALSANNLSDRISVEGAKNELKDLALVINGMLDRIELSYNSQKQFVSDASHELRTPIAVIQGYVNMLNRWGKDDKTVLEEGITAIAQETESMKGLVESLLFLARHDKKTLLMEMEPFDPCEVVSEVHREAAMVSPDYTFLLQPLEHCRIEADKGMVKQVMRILCDNAVKYTPTGGTITLGVEAWNGGCTLLCSDNGSGISPEDLPKIFERFYRSDSARKAESSGHGLGLSIARIIVVAHGGKIRVRSKPGAGTTFAITLPAKQKR